MQNETQKMRYNDERGILSFRNLAIMYMQYVVFSNDDVVILNIEGFSVIISKAENFVEKFVCVATFVYNRAGKNEKKAYYIKSIIQLNKWLSCIRNHSRQSYILGYSNNFSQIPNALMSEPIYLMTRLDDIMEQK